MSSLFIAAVPKVKIDPDPNGLPGSNVLQSMINGLAFWMLLAAVAGILFSAGIWGLASHSNNPHWAMRGRSGVLVSLGAALIIGAAAALINFFVSLGGQV